ncbi:sigma-70 family RNA polymerase sigma factor [Compostibacter hankyongensis]|uniref:RNA polymerase sigma-70 factor n=1 Tax=Compostibacter hankyongensis TaxID=1007089 RepID=A0ABP8FE67_9BACT
MDNALYHDSLFRQLAVGSEPAFRKIFHAYNAQLHPFIFRMTGSGYVTEDIIQETFLRLWIHRAEVGRMDRPVSWLYTVASNLSLSWLRARVSEHRRLARIETEHRTAPHPDEGNLSLKEIQLLVAEAVALLPPKRQQIYRLSREQGLNHQEIAEQLQLSPNTIKNQLVSALKFIKVYLQKAGGLAAPLLILIFGH